jgi:hypothetical protein
MNNPVEHARAALEGRIEVPAPSVVCEVCEREIPQATAHVIPGIGFMCPPDVDHICEPQRSLFDMVRDLQRQAHDATVEAVHHMLAVVYSEALYFEHAEDEREDVFAKWADIIVRAVKERK